MSNDIFPVKLLEEQLEKLNSNPFKYYISTDVAFGDATKCSLLYKMYDDGTVEIVHSMQSKANKIIFNVMLQEVAKYFKAEIVELKPLIK